jgi:hypothetical protein
MTRHRFLFRAASEGMVPRWCAQSPGGSPKRRTYEERLKFAIEIRGKKGTRLPNEKESGDKSPHSKERIHETSSAASPRGLPIQNGVATNHATVATTMIHLQVSNSKCPVA